MSARTKKIHGRRVCHIPVIFFFFIFLAIGTTKLRGGDCGDKQAQVARKCNHLWVLRARMYQALTWKQNGHATTNLELDVAVTATLAIVYWVCSNDSRKTLDCPPLALNKNEKNLCWICKGCIYRVMRMRAHLRARFMSLDSNGTTKSNAAINLTVPRAWFSMHYSRGRHHCCTTARWWVNTWKIMLHRLYASTLYVLQKETYVGKFGCAQK